MSRESFPNDVPKPAGNTATYMSIVAAGFGMFLAALDISVNVALPAMRTGLGSDLHSIQWVIVVFVATRAGLVIGIGNLADKFGLKSIFIFGAGIYLFSMVFISLSDTLSYVVIFRITQAIGTGSLYAVSPAIAAQSFPTNRQGLAMGFTTASQALGMLAGTIGAGWLMLWFPWQSVFLFRIPFLLMALAIALIFMKHFRRSDKSLPLDILGGLTLMIGLCSLVIGLRLGRAIGWLDPIVVSCLILTPIAMIIFWRNTSKAEYPVLPKTLLKSRYFATALASMFLAHMGIFVIWFVFPFYIIDILGLGALFLGVMLAVMASFNTVSSLVAGYLIDRIGHRIIGLTGLLSLSLGLFTMAYLTPDSNLFEIGFRIAIVGIGIGLFQSAAYYQVISNTSGERMGTASGALSMSQSFGTVFSVATIGAIFAIISQTESNLLNASGVFGPDLKALAFMKAYQDVFHIGSIVALVSVPIFTLLSKQNST